jgi:hypothetical protein
MIFEVVKRIIPRIKTTNVETLTYCILTLELGNQKSFVAFSMNLTNLSLETRIVCPALNDGESAVSVKKA